MTHCQAAFHCQQTNIASRTVCIISLIIICAQNAAMAVTNDMQFSEVAANDHLGPGLRPAHDSFGSATDIEQWTIEMPGSQLICEQDRI